jgi:mannose-6-phosphate isomerase-like protein (cupin superfamily)
MDMNLSPRIQSSEEGQAFWYLNGLVNIRINGANTGGQFSWIDELLPTGMETPYHIHHNEDETFYIIEGETEFVLNGSLIDAGAGAIVFLPKKIPHGFRVVGDHPARIINLVSPSGFERLFIEAGDPATSMELPTPYAPDFSRVVEACKKLDIEILGPITKFIKE